MPNMQEEIPLIEISVADQKLRLTTSAGICDWPIATARNGVGELSGSGCTPRGWHRVVAKIGEGLPLNSVLVGRRPTGEIYTPELAQQYPQRDWILTRILWLQGLEVGKNRFGQVDTMQRYIYIHGVPDSKPMGVPGSSGCINMHNNDLLELFERISVGVKVWIDETSLKAPLQCIK